MLSVSDTLIASADYWLAAAADEIAVTPTAQIGSIGVVAMIREARDQAGEPGGSTRLRIFRSGQHKLMGADAPLTEAQAAFVQSKVDAIGTQFRAFVRRARGDQVPEDAMQGLVYDGPSALRLGLVDRVHRNLAAALA